LRLDDFGVENPVEEDSLDEWRRLDVELLRLDESFLGDFDLLERLDLDLDTDFDDRCDEAGDDRGVTSMSLAVGEDMDFSRSGNSVGNGDFGTLSFTIDFGDRGFSGCASPSSISDRVRLVDCCCGSSTSLLRLDDREVSCAISSSCCGALEVLGASCCWLSSPVMVTDKIGV
jgi:hypothetical protein